MDIMNPSSILPTSRPLPPNLPPRISSKPNSLTSKSKSTSSFGRKTRANRDTAQASEVVSPILPSDQVEKFLRSPTPISKAEYFKKALKLGEKLLSLTQDLSKPEFKKTPAYQRFLKLFLEKLPSSSALATSKATLKMNGEFIALPQNYQSLLKASGSASTALTKMIQAQSFTKEGLYAAFKFALSVIKLGLGIASIVSAALFLGGSALPAWAIYTLMGLSIPGALNEEYEQIADYRQVTQLLSEWENVAEGVNATNFEEAKKILQSSLEKLDTLRNENDPLKKDRIITIDTVGRRNLTLLRKALERLDASPGQNRDKRDLEILQKSLCTLAELKGHIQLSKQGYQNILEASLDCLALIGMPPLVNSLTDIYFAISKFWKVIYLPESD